MILIKAMMTGLIGILLCMADITGIVTDTGTTPVGGAVVQLEKGKQTAISGADGRFTIALKTALTPGIGKHMPQGLSAEISGTRLTITLAKRSTVEVSTFDLSGKSLSTVCQTYNAGTHFLSLPFRGTGIFLYKIKSDNSEFVLKGNAVGGITRSSTFLNNILSLNELAKQAQITASINEVLTATKPGFLNYRCVHYNSDASGVVIKMIASSLPVTDKEGNVYQTVKIGNQVWMAENLRVTKYNDGTAIPLVTGNAAWDLSTKAGYSFFKNTTNQDSIKKYGALYNWYVVNPANPKKIAPAGWHVPTDEDWNILQNYLVTKGYNWDGTTTENKIGKSLAAKTDWQTSITAGTIGSDLTKNNSTGFSAPGAGIRFFDGLFFLQYQYACWWSTFESDTELAFARLLTNENAFLERNEEIKSSGFSIRLLKD